MLRETGWKPMLQCRPETCACAAPSSGYTAGRGALPRDRRCTSNKDEHRSFGNRRNRITESEKTVLRRATPVARERAPTGANSHPAAARHIQKKRLTRSPNPQVSPNRMDPQCYRPNETYVSKMDTSLEPFPRDPLDGSFSYESHSHSA